MKYKCIGILGILFGMVVFSLELYGLKVIQALERVSGSCYVNPFRYISEEPCVVIAFIITVCVVISSIVIYLYGREEINNKCESIKENEK